MYHTQQHLQQQVHRQQQHHQQQPQQPTPPQQQRQSQQQYSYSHGMPSQQGQQVSFIFYFFFLGERLSKKRLSV